MTETVKPTEDNSLTESNVKALLEELPPTGLTRDQIHEHNVHVNEHHVVMSGMSQADFQAALEKMREEDPEAFAAYEAKNK